MAHSRVARPGRPGISLQSRDWSVYLDYFIVFVLALYGVTVLWRPFLALIQMRWIDLALESAYQIMTAQKTEFLLHHL